MAKYCLPDVVFQNGKSGNFFNSEMCEGQGVAQLKLKHASGVNEYCQKSNGYNAGTVGRPYNKICPATLEKDFLPEFNRGRRRYLATVKSQNDQQIAEYNRELSKVQNELNYKQGLLTGLRVVTATNQTKEQQEKLNKLSSEVSSLQSQSSSIERKKQSLQSKNREIEIEMVQLGN
jgi:hypothetical protein